MEITVAICTWNRARLLDETLTHLAELVVPSGLEWELLVINNNCTDHTDEVNMALGRAFIECGSTPLPNGGVATVDGGDCSRIPRSDAAE